LVLVFFCTTCPTSVAYDTRVNALYAKYVDRGVQVFGIDSCVHDDPETLRVGAAKRGVTYPVLRDEGNRWADALGAYNASATYIVDREGVLRYRGAFDNGKALEDPERVAFAANALDDLLAGASLRTPETRPFG